MSDFSSELRSISMESKLLKQQEERNILMLEKTLAEEKESFSNLLVGNAEKGMDFIYLTTLNGLMPEHKKNGLFWGFIHDSGLRIEYIKDGVKIWWDGRLPNELLQVSAPMYVIYREESEVLGSGSIRSGHEKFKDMQKAKEKFGSGYYTNFDIELSIYYDNRSKLCAFRKQYRTDPYYLCETPNSRYIKPEHFMYIAEKKRVYVVEGFDTDLLKFYESIV